MQLKPRITRIYAGVGDRTVDQKQISSGTARESDPVASFPFDAFSRDDLRDSPLIFV
jgi:hypothetical protein